MHRPFPTLSSLPDDVLLRIIALTGGPGTQVGTAYRLGAVCLRFRSLLKSSFLFSVTKLSQDFLSALSLSNPPDARMALTSMFSAMPAVKELNLGGCPRALFNRESIAALANTAGSALTIVNFAYCRVTDDVVSPLLQCPNLKELSLYSCNCLTGSMFQDSENIVAPLEFLDLSWVNSLSREGVRAIAKVKTLKDLVLTGVDTVNSGTLSAFMREDVRLSLVSVCLSYCPLRDSALRDLLSALPNLRKLTLAETTGNLWETGHFSPGGIENLRFQFPDVDIEFVT